MTAPAHLHPILNPAWNQTGAFSTTGERFPLFVSLCVWRHKACSIFLVTDQEFRYVLKRFDWQFLYFAKLGLESENNLKSVENRMF